MCNAPLSRGPSSAHLVRVAKLHLKRLVSASLTRANTTTIRSSGGFLRNSEWIRELILYSIQGKKSIVADVLIETKLMDAFRASPQMCR